MKENIQDKKALVLNATLELISEQGFHGTPVSQIAKRAKVAVGTIYLYFPNKEDIINTLYIDIKTRLAQYILKNYSEERTIKESFLVILHNIVDYFVKYPKEFLFIEQYSNSPLITSNTKEEGIDIFMPVRELFNKAQKEKLIKELPIEMLIILTNGATLSLVKLCLFSDVKVDEAILEAGLEAIWDTIKK
ncbi:TetR/AcrR family transcriptional regulator [Clostridium massiliamazoniense]|uniref:TetR/AcrR family transcriptional regulator n=1 Tax=Clostridium massiliamazoniense TaxID=1347366 RepID=UPI0006D85C3A|nr:TetR/AcrR family transcriptional regulator [Clostridium massiliamazoniense]